jgi:zinc and cadmium transporter
MLFSNTLGTGILGWILLFTAIGGLLSAGVAGLFLLLPGQLRQRVLPHMVSFATGALLGAALLALVPHAVEGVGPAHVHSVGIALVSGIALFFILEKFLLWRHCHIDDCDTHDQTHGHAHDASRLQASGTLILVGDALHNALDGVLIAAAFLTDWHLGMVTALAIMAHEIPQEVGNFAVLLQAGMARGRALFWNLMSSLTSVLGGAIAWYSLRGAMQLLPYALAVAAASMLYVAVADLIPGLHRRTDAGASVAQVLLIGAGVLVVAFAESQAH